jgi:two-component system, sensor histidine kinase and response regulator
MAGAAPIMMMNTTRSNSPLHDARPGFDVAGALDRLGGNIPLLHDLMCRFVREHADSADDVDALVAARKPAHAVAALHRLKGAARIVGAVALASAAQRAEDLLMTGDAAGLADFRGALDAACVQCRSITRA